jgi:ABC-2 type transport system ATP-binding protein
MHDQLVMNPPTADHIWPEPAFPAGEDALRVLGLEKTFTQGFWRRRIPAVRGISFTLTRGRVLALLGHNGAGKTTTIGCIMGLIQPDVGEIRLFGEPHTRPAARRRVGYLPERPNFYEHLSGRELLRFYARLLELPGRDIETAVDRALTRVGMRRHEGLSIRKHSKGMLQRLGLAQALLGDPDLLILDEPMSGLDPIGRRDVRDLLAEERERGTTIVLSSHIVPDVEVLADTAVFLREGLLVADRELDRTAPAEFVVVAERLPEVEAGDAALARCVRTTPPQPGGPGVVTAPDAAALARLLDLCARERIAIRDVRAQRSRLEDEFLAAMAGTEADRC